MTPHDVSRYVRQTRKFAFALATLHVFLWLYFMYRTAGAGQIGNTVLGAIFLLSVICLWSLLDHLLSVQAWWMPLLRRSAELEDRLMAMERRVEALQASDAIDLVAGEQPSHASELVAATLAESTFPRLAGRPFREDHADSMRPPGAQAGATAGASAAASEAPPVARRAADVSFGSRGREVSAEPPPASSELRNGALTRWREALAGGALIEAGSMLDRWRTSRPVAFVAQRESELAAAAQLTFDALRADFARHVREGDYGAALAAGRRISRLFPDSRPARDFERLRPLLQRRVDDPAAGDSLSAAMLRG